MNFRRKNDPAGESRWSQDKRKADRETLAGALQDLVSGILGKGCSLTADNCQAAVRHYMETDKKRALLEQQSRQAQKEVRKLKGDVYRLENKGNADSKVAKLELEIAQYRQMIAKLQGGTTSNSRPGDSRRVAQLEGRVKELEAKVQSQKDVFQKTLEIRDVELSIRTKERNSKAQQLKQLQHKMRASAPVNDASFQSRKGVMSREKQLNQELAETRFKLSAANRRISELERSEVSVATATANRKELDKAKSQIAELLKTTTAAAASHCKEREEHEAKITKLQKDLTQSNTALADALAESAEKSADRATHDNPEIEILKVKLAAAEKKIEKLEVEDAEELEEAEEELRKSEAKVAQLTEQLKSSSSKAEDHGSTVSEDSKSLEELRYKLVAAERKIETLEGEDAEELEEAEEALRKSETKIAELTKRLKASNASANGSSEQENALRATETALSESQATISELRASLAEATEAATTSSRGEMAVVTARSNNSASDEHEGSDSDSDSDEDSDSDSDEESDSDSDSASDGSRSDNGSRQSGTRKLKQKLETTRSRLSAAQQKIAELEEAGEAAGSELVELRTKIAKLNAAMNARPGASDASVIGERAFTVREQKLIKQLSETIAKLSASNQQIAALEAKEEEADEMAAEAEAERAQELDARKERITELESENEKLNKENERLKENKRLDGPMAAEDKASKPETESQRSAAVKTLLAVEVDKELEKIGVKVAKLRESLAKSSEAMKSDDSSSGGATGTTNSKERKLKMKLIDTVSKLSDAQHQLSALEEKSDVKIAELTALVETLKSELADGRLLVENLSRALEEVRLNLRNSTECTSYLELEVEELTKKDIEVRQTEAEVERLLKKLETAESLAKESKALESTTRMNEQRLEMKLAETTSAFAVTREELQSVREVELEATRRAEQSEAKVIELKETVATLSEELSAVRSELPPGKSRKKALGVISSEETREHKLLQKLTDTMSELSDARRRISAFEKDESKTLVTLEEQLKSSREEVTELKMLLMQSKTLAQGRMVENRTDDNETTSANESMGTKELEDTKKRLRNVEEKLSTLETEETEELLEAEELQRKSEARVVVLSNQLEKANAALANANRKIADTDSNSEEFNKLSQKELEATKAKLRDAEEKLSALQAEEADSLLLEAAEELLLEREVQNKVLREQVEKLIDVGAEMENQLRQELDETTDKLGETEALLCSLQEERDQENVEVQAIVQENDGKLQLLKKQVETICTAQDMGLADIETAASEMSSNEKVFWRLRRQLKGYETMVRQLSKQANSAEASYSTVLALQQELAEAKSALARSHEEFSSQDSSYQEELTTASERLVEYENKLQYLTEQLGAEAVDISSQTGLQNELETTKTLLAHAEEAIATRDEDHKKELATTNERAQERETEISLLSEQLASFEAREETLKKEIHDSRSLMDGIQEELQESKTQAREYEIKVLSLTEKMENTERAGKDAQQELEKTLEETRAELLETRKLLGDSKEMDNTVFEYQSKLEASEVEVSLLSEELEKVRGEQNNLLKELTKLQLSESTKDDLMQTELDKTKQLLEQARLEMSSQEATYQNELNGTKQLLSDYEKKLQYLTEQLAGAEAVDSSAQTGLQKELETTKTLLAHAEEAIATRDEDHKKELATTNERAQERETEISLLSEQLASFEAREETLKKEIHDSRSLMDGIQEELQESKTQAREYEIKVLSLTEKIENTERAGKDAQQELEKTLEEIRAELLEAQKLLATSEEMNGIVSDNQSKLEESEAEVALLSEELEKVKGEQNNLLKELTKLQLSESTNNGVANGQSETEERLRASEARVAELAEQLEQLNDAGSKILNESQDEIFYLSEELKKANVISSEAETRLEKELDQTTAQLVELEFQLSARDHEDSKELLEARETLKETCEVVKEKEEEIRQLSNQLKSVRAAGSGEDQLQTNELKDARCQLMQLEQKISTLEADALQQRAEAASMLRQSEAYVEELREQLQLAESQAAANLAKELEDTKAQLLCAHDRLSSLNAEHATELERVLGMETRLKNDLEDIMFQLREAEEMLASRDDEVRLLTKHLEDAKAAQDPSFSGGYDGLEFDDLVEQMQREQRISGGDCSDYSSDEG